LGLLFCDGLSRALLLADKAGTSDRTERERLESRPSG